MCIEIIFFHLFFFFTIGLRTSHVIAIYVSISSVSYVSLFVCVLFCFFQVKTRLPPTDTEFRFPSWKHLFVSVALAFCLISRAKWKKKKHFSPWFLPNVFLALSNFFDDSLKEKLLLEDTEAQIGCNDSDGRMMPKREQETTKAPMQNLIKVISLFTLPHWNISLVDRCPWLCVCVCVFMRLYLYSCFGYFATFNQRLHFVECFFLFLFFFRNFLYFRLFFCLLAFTFYTQSHTDPHS